MPSMTLTVDAQGMADLQYAFGQMFNLGRDATPAEVKSYISQYPINVVQQIKLRDAQRAAQAGIVPIVVT